MRSIRCVLAALALAACCAPRARAEGGDRFVLAWPPTRYARAEIVVWRDEGTGPVEARVLARGLDVTVPVEADAASRVVLPPSAQCRVGVDDCAIVVQRVTGRAALHVLLQSPDTIGAADTLLLTAHDTVRIPPAAACGRSHVVIAAPNAGGSAFPQSASVATIVPVAGGTRIVTGGASCASDLDEAVAEGSAVTIACTGAGADLSGLLVESDAPVLVLSGNVVTPVPTGDSTLSGDLVLDLSPAVPSTPTTLVAAPWPRGAAHEGRGDVVRIVAGGAGRARVRDDEGGDRVIALAVGDVLDLDTGGSGRDRVLRLDLEGPLVAWHVTKSRALRGTGDPAAIPLVPRAGFTTSDRVFVPDGYSEGTHLSIVAEAGADVRLDGVSLGPLEPAPGGDLAWIVVEIPEGAPITGTMHELASDRPFGATLVGFGGYKAHGCTAARRWSEGTLVLRGTRPDALAPVGRVAGRGHVDAAPEAAVHWSVEADGATLRVARCPGGACLAW